MTWVLDTRLNTLGEYRIFDSETELFVASVASKRHARLITAAPQLAEALRAILAESDTITCGRLMSDAFAHARAALTAAGVQS